MKRSYTPLLLVALTTASACGSQSFVDWLKEMPVADIVKDVHQVATKHASAVHKAVVEKSQKLKQAVADNAREFKKTVADHPVITGIAAGLAVAQLCSIAAFNTARDELAHWRYAEYEIDRRQRWERYNTKEIARFENLRESFDCLYDQIKKLEEHCFSRALENLNFENIYDEKHLPCRETLNAMLAELESRVQKLEEHVIGYSSAHLGTTFGPYGPSLYQDVIDNMASRVWKLKDVAFGYNDCCCSHTCS